MASLVDVAGEENTESVMLAVKCIDPEVTMLLLFSAHWQALLHSPA